MGKVKSLKARQVCLDIKVTYCIPSEDSNAALRFCKQDSTPYSQPSSLSEDPPIESAVYCRVQNADGTVVMNRSSWHVFQLLGAIDRPPWPVMHKMSPTLTRQTPCSPPKIHFPCMNLPFSANMNHENQSPPAVRTLESMT